MTANPHLGVILLGLLACNTAYYLLAGRFSEALESVAWYVLLILFMLESRDPRITARTLAVMRGMRAIASVAIAASAVLYVREKAWLDALNLLLWIAVVALLETELRFPSIILARRTAFTRAAIALYAALSAMVVVWLGRGQWMNAWDAGLWLAAFGLLEMRLLSRIS